MSNIAIAGDTSGTVTLQAPAISGTTVLTLPTTNGTLVTTASGQALTSPTITGTATLNGVNMTPYSMKNRVINGGMVINQRGLGTVNPVSGDGLKYTIDRFWVYNGVAASKFSVQQSSTAPAGYINSALITVTNAYTPTGSEEFDIGQLIEGLNISDLAWGTADAKTVTLSFWVRSSVTGTFGGSLVNSGYNRSYPFSYTISSANTWEQKTITITGDTTGTWLTTNGVGIRLVFSLGVGASKTTTAGAWAAGEYYNSTGSINLVANAGATFYLTGVQLEVGSVASAFEWRPYTTELQLCQRYFEKSFNDGTAPANGASGTTWASGSGLNAFCSSNNSAPGGTLKFLVTKRSDPTITIYGNNAGAWAFVNPTASTSVSWSTAVVFGAGANGTTVGNAAFNNTLYCFYGHWTASAEL